jgi:hypothetical protein
VRTGDAFANTRRGSSAHPRRARGDPVEQSFKIGEPHHGLRETFEEIACRFSDATRSAPFYLVHEVLSLAWSKRLQSYPRSW